MKLPLALFAVMLISTTAIAADKTAAKPKPCPKGQVATTNTLTDKQACFAMQMMTVPGQPGPVNGTAKPRHP